MATPASFICQLFPTNPTTDDAVDAGFRFGPKGTHTSRTMMLEELRTIMGKLSASSQKEAYVHAIIEDNCLAKNTSATRRLTCQRLAELYSLDIYVPVFRILRRLWSSESAGIPLLALLCTIARDPLLASTAPAILSLPPGADFARVPLKDALRNCVGERLNEAILDKVVRNVASSWTQSGHLSGRTLKKRSKVTATPASVAFGLYLAHKAGFRGQDLFTSGWMALLDCTLPDAQALAIEAKRDGLIDLRISGNIIDIRLDPLDPFLVRR